MGDFSLNHIKRRDAVLLLRELSASPILDKRLTEGLSNIADCIQYEVDNKVCVWYGDEPPPEITEEKRCTDAVDFFNDMTFEETNVSDNEDEWRVLRKEIPFALNSISLCIRLEQDGYDFWGKSAEHCNRVFEYVRELGTDWEMPITTYMKYLTNKYKIKTPK